MSIALTILVACLPVFALLWYFWHRDRGEKEPLPLMNKIFLLGVAVTIPVAVTELILQYFALLLPIPLIIFTFLTAMFFVALPEEYAKFWVVRKFAYKNGNFNEIMDGITYCILASMGFAILENVLYTIQFGVGVGVMRAFTAVPAHALFSGIMGYYMGMAKFSKDPKAEERLLRKGLFLGVLFHGLYDFFLLSGSPYLIIMVVPLLGYMGTILHYAIRLANAGRRQEIKFF